MESTTGRRIKELRKAKGMSVETLAEKLGVKPTAIYGLEKDANRPSFDTITGLLDTFPDVNPDWLLKGIGSMFRNGNELTPVEAPTTTAPRYNRTPQAGPEIVPESGEVTQLKERLKDKDTIIEILRERIEELRSYLPEQLGKFLPDSFAAEPRPTVGFVLSKVTMTCGENTYTDTRQEALAIWNGGARLQA